MKQTFYQNLELLQTTFDNIAYEMYLKRMSLLIFPSMVMMILRTSIEFLAGEKNRVGDIVFVGLGVIDTSKINLEK